MGVREYGQHQRRTERITPAAPLCWGLPLREHPISSRVGFDSEDRTTEQQHTLCTVVARSNLRRASPAAARSVGRWQESGAAELAAS